MREGDMVSVEVTGGRWAHGLIVRWNGNPASVVRVLTQEKPYYLYGKYCQNCYPVLEIDKTEREALGAFARSKAGRALIVAATLRPTVVIDARGKTRNKGAPMRDPSMGMGHPDPLDIPIRTVTRDRPSWPSGQLLSHIMASGQVREGLHRLREKSPRQYELYVRHYFEHMRLADIARLLDISYANAKYHHAQAARFMRRVVLESDFRP